MLALYYLGQKNWDNRTPLDTGECSLEHARACSFALRCCLFLCRFASRGCLNFFLARVSTVDLPMWTQETGKQIVGARVGDVISRSTDWRKTSQVRLPTSASRHYTHRKKKLSDFATRKEPLPFGSGRKLKSQDLCKKGSKGRGRIGGDGHTVDPYVRHNTDKNPYLFTEPRRLAVFCLPPSSLKGQHVHNHMWINIFLPFFRCCCWLETASMVWVWIWKFEFVRVAAKPAKGYFPLSRLRFPN